MAFGGLAVVLFDRDESGPTSTRARLPWLGLGLVGLAAGFGSRGGILGLGVPLLAIGIAWLVTLAVGRRLGNDLADGVGAAALGLGAIAVGLGAYAILPDVQSSSKLLPVVSWGQSRASDLNMWIGAAVKTPTKYPTFDYYIGHLGPALAPWSAVRAVRRRPPARAPGGPRHAARALRARELHADGPARRHLRRPGRARLPRAADRAHRVLRARPHRRDLRPRAPRLRARRAPVGRLRRRRRRLPRHLPPRLPRAPREGVPGVRASTRPRSPRASRSTRCSSGPSCSSASPGSRSSPGSSATPTRTPFEPKGYLHVIVSLREAWDGLLALVFLALVAGASIAGVVIAVGIAPEGALAREHLAPDPRRDRSTSGGSRRSSRSAPSSGSTSRATCGSGPSAGRGRGAARRSCAGSSRSSSSTPR